MIEGRWQAWYGELSEGGLPVLHVVGEFAADRPLGALRLEQDPDGDRGANVICLTLVEEPGEQGRSEREVTWSGRPEEKITEVRVAGALEATLPVRDDR